MKILIADGCCIVIEYFNFWQKEKLHFCSASPKHVFHSSSYKRFYPGSKLSLFRSCVCSDLENCFPLKTRSGYKSTFVATGSQITEGQMKLQQFLNHIWLGLFKKCREQSWYKVADGITDMFLACVFRQSVVLCCIVLYCVVLYCVVLCLDNQLNWQSQYHSIFTPSNHSLCFGISYLLLVFIYLLLSTWSSQDVNHKTYNVVPSSLNSIFHPNGQLASYQVGVGSRKLSKLFSYIAGKHMYTERGYIDH